MYYDVQWSDYRNNIYLPPISMHSHNILVHSIYSLEMIPHIYKYTRYTQREYIHTPRSYICFLSHKTCSPTPINTYAYKEWNIKQSERLKNVKENQRGKERARHTQRKREHREWNECENQWDTHRQIETLKRTLWSIDSHTQMRTLNIIHFMHLLHWMACDCILYV